MRQNCPPALTALVLCAALFPPAFAGPPAPGKYIGPGSCAATSCHGSVKPVPGSRILQNEYSTWVVQDRHSRSYQALTSDVGERMARILKLGSKAEEAPKCLACHALYTTAEERGRAFDIAEGVSCESCHGPAQEWLGQHTGRESPEKHAESVRLGLSDTRNLLTRAAKCLECHLGTRQKFVDHEMISAGHPDLYFELDSFSAVMPRHWKQPRETAAGQPAEDPAWVSVREWSAGQAVQLAAELDRLAWRAAGERNDKKDVWPEYSELSCFACHHSLGPAKDSWRQEHGYSGRRAGDPAWNGSRYVVFRIIAAQADPAAAQDLDRLLFGLAAEISKLDADRSAIAAKARAAGPLAQRFAERLAAMPYDRALALRLLQRIADDSETIALADERAAEQATMAIDSLYIAYAKQAKPGNAPEARTAINGLFAQLENPSAYNADTFSAALRRLRPLLQ